MGIKDYRNIAWLEFRKSAFSQLGNFCSRCFRADHEVCLQVHHKLYIDGRKPWEYNLTDCEVLCSGCHAREHGHIRPDCGWHLSHSNDLGSLVGTCELCQSSLRYEYHIFHNNWHEEIIVGTHCCDNLTGDKEATQFKRKMEAFERFKKSPKWYESDHGERLYRQNKYFDFSIRKKDLSYLIEINGNQGNKRFDNLDEILYFLFCLINDKTYLKVFTTKGELNRKN